MSDNYQAIVVKLKEIRKHSNADRLQCTNLLSMNVIVGLDAKEGDVGIFFPLESQLGEKFAEVNDLIRRKDENGKNCGGMFDNNRRVRCQTLRGEKSMGFFCPLSLLEVAGVSKKTIESLKENDSFNELDGIEISKKYVNLRKSNSSNGEGKKGKAPKKKKISKLVEGQFKFHFDTDQLYKNIHRIKPDDLISVTVKFHGTSFCFSHVLCNKKLKWYEKLLIKFGINIPTTEYDYLYASRKVVKNEFEKECNHFYDEDIWTKAGKQFEGKLNKGETIYGEIVGFTSSGKMIQRGYDYKVPEGQFKIYVYRITMTNVDGVVTELPWNQVKHRCNELGVSHVIELYYGKAKDYYKFDKETWFNTSELTEWSNGLFEKLKSDYVYDQDSQFCSSRVPEEGIVLRVEEGDGITNYKMKAFRFYEWETKQLDSGEEDIEEN